MDIVDKKSLEVIICATRHVAMFIAWGIVLQ